MFKKFHNVNLVVEEGRSCVIQLNSKTPLHSASSLTSKSSCGTRLQPWIVESRVGQQINVSLLDFSTPSPEKTKNEGPDTPQCLMYGYILDKSAEKNISICSFGKERESFVHLSKTNSLELILISNQQSDAALNFNYLVRFAGS